MRLDGERESDNVEDLRGESAGGYDDGGGGFGGYGGYGGGGGMPGPRMVVGGGIGTVILIIVLMLLGVNPQALFQGPPPGARPGMPGPARVNRQVHRERERGEEDEGKKFVSIVLAETEDVWRDLFPKKLGKRYRDPHLVLFTGEVQSGCGFTGAAVGPFYCPADERVYLDLSFLDELRTRFRAPGDFAAAYVIAHEIGHHVQKQLGVSQKMEAARGRVSKQEYNRLSVRLELQADFLAGVWAHYAQEMKHILDPGDLEEALNAAKAVGDDRLQKQARGYVVPDAFTHGTSEQRARWFRRGFETGDVSLMDELFEKPYSEL